jgi:hypothetical protein
MPAASKSAPVDTNQWSEESKRRLHYLPAPNVYEDKVFACRRCGCKAIFTAEQQKREYEVKKANTLRQHVLCHTCFVAWHELGAESDLFSNRWQNDKAGFKKDPPAIKRWIEVLNLLPQYGGYKDAGRIRMLEKLFSNAA